MMQLLYTQRMWRSCIILDGLEKPFNMKGIVLRLYGVFEGNKERTANHMCLCVHGFGGCGRGGGAVFNFVLGFFRKSSLCQTESVNL